LGIFNQFRRAANFYFLLAAILQSIPTISPLSPLTAVTPLLFVIILSLTREGIEDYIRYKSDKNTNRQQYNVLKNGHNWQKIRSDEI
jgi:magnesium-transporting ATPase (P-type)